MSQNILLLTATINSRKGIPALSRLDPDQRRADYARAFRFYLGLLGRPLDKIVLVENSASDLTDLERLAREAGAADRVELISFFGQDFPPEYGRAYSEFRTIDHATERSETLRGGDRIIWKMTGRYLVRNLPRIIAKRPETFDLYCNMRNYPSRWADMYLLAWTGVGYEGVLKGLAPRLRQDAGAGSPEEEFWRVIDEAGRHYKIVPRFRQIPYIDGIRGFDNKNYMEESGRWKFMARRIALYVAPWLWI
ncbi:hypothetical protein [Paludisphaera borealis]|uniref:Glycosyltransferase 2-like domain-containing protein n=1 Tax=Paludisphaera borealis TaxID=1387353 RepID=A0A1U7CTY5_9BACT|nr:hypothetical protein [Paludisphaera borealis]APW62407.1 hypothetical protein BSF38_03946 [Paludisphaera borealis]